MAEGFARHFYGDKFDVYSAGIEKHGMNTRAIQVMKEAGVDISKQYSKTFDDLGDIQFDLVITVCGHANELCPIFSGKAIVKHVGFDDPPKLAAGLSDETEIIPHYRRVRDEIKSYFLNSFTFS